jgi:hypothetical protein
LRPGLGAAHFALGLVLQAMGDTAANEELRNARMLEELAAPRDAKTGPPPP